jgi:hypothetical protein
MTTVDADVLLDPRPLWIEIVVSHRVAYSKTPDRYVSVLEFGVSVLLSPTTYGYAVCALHTAWRTLHRTARQLHRGALTPAWQPCE